MNAVTDELILDHPYVDAVVNYTRKTGVRPVNYTFDPPAGVLRNSGEVEPHVVRIRNARHAHGLALDASGFEMIRHSTSLTDWNSFTDADRVRKIDYPEVEAVLKRHVRADKVLIFDHTLRDSTAEPGRTALRNPCAGYTMIKRWTRRHCAWQDISLVRRLSGD